MDRFSPVGVFDSGLGGISVLRGILQELPGEDCYYFGDSRHAPYGVRPVEEVRALARGAVEHLLEQGCKAIVIACNTATSAAAAQLREEFPQIPIIGIEPALKPAVERHPGGRILVMATAMTLQEQKFLDLWDQYKEYAEIVPVPCSGLMEFVERGELWGDELERFLLEKLQPFTKVPVDAVVLGCTHYPFLRGTLRKLMGRGPEILDGAEGVARQLRRILEARELCNPGEKGTVTFENSLEGPEMLQLSQALLSCPMEEAAGSSETDAGDVRRSQTEACL